MATLIPPYGTKPVSLVLDNEEAFSLLALLNHNPAFWNRDLRAKLGAYIDRTKEDQND